MICVRNSCSCAEAKVVRLHSDWRRIIRKAWSFRLIVLAGVLSGVETVIPYLGDFVPEKGIFSGLTVLVTVAAALARVVAQPKMED